MKGILTLRLFDGYCLMHARDKAGLEKQRFKERRSTELRPLSPELVALIGQPVTAHVWPGIEEAHQKKRAARKERKAKRKAEAAKRHKPSSNDRETFYASWEWRTLRMKVLQTQGRVCKCCGAMPGQLTEGGEPVRLVVDHIKPLGTHWELRLTYANLQVLCDSCNMGKGGRHIVDFR